MMHQELEKGETTMQMSERKHDEKNGLGVRHPGRNVERWNATHSDIGKAGKEGGAIILWFGFFLFGTAVCTVLKRTPVLARFHLRVYFSKSSDSSNHEEIDIDEKNSHRQRSSV